MLMCTVAVIFEEFMAKFAYFIKNLVGGSAPRHRLQRMKAFQKLF